MKSIVIFLILVLVLSACTAKPSEEDPHDFPTDTLSQDLVRSFTRMFTMMPKSAIPTISANNTLT
jgi:hypothetical protein